METKINVCYFGGDSLLEYEKKLSFSDFIEFIKIDNIIELVDLILLKKIDCLFIDVVNFDINWCSDLIKQIKSRVSIIEFPVCALVKDLPEEKKIKLKNSGIEYIYEISSIHENFEGLIKDILEINFEKPEKIKAIVIDDNEDEMIILKTILDRLGITALEASNGQDARKFINEKDVSLIICDIFMPEIDGYETCKYFKSREAFKKIPFIALSSLGGIEQMQKIFDLGANEFIKRPFTFEEFIARIKVQLRLKHFYDEIERMVASEERLNKKLLELNDKLNIMAITDYLTNIYNRRYILEYLSKEIEKCRRYNGQFSICIIDIDYFKNVNDTYGHIAGDEVLKSLSKLINNSIRQSDVFGRFGGEEFLIIYNGTDELSANKAGNKLREIIENTDFKIGEIDIKITISGGITQFEHDDDVNKIIARADKALYKAKEMGRNNIKIFELI